MRASRLLAPDSRIALASLEDFLRYESIVLIVVLVLVDLWLGEGCGLISLKSFSAVADFHHGFGAVRSFAGGVHFSFLLEWKGYN